MSGKIRVGDELAVERETRRKHHQRKKITDCKYSVIIKQILQNKPPVAKIGFDTTEKEPFKL